MIEIDGDVHFTETAAAYDAERTQVLEGYGLQVIRFTNEQVMGDFEVVYQKIREMIPPSPPFSRGEPNQWFEVSPNVQSDLLQPFC